jgi:2-polyprenyl-3-methyl-5-hydroxy-6-metoxy-1,4-benzoquinol methylase
MAKDNSVMREWDEAAESFTNFVREGKDYLREELNNPTAFRLIGNVKGKRVLDLACGEGCNTRILAKNGAIVVGVDFLERLIELARQKETEERLDITYYVSDAADLKELPSNYFDLVTCFMALHDIEHY